MILDLKPRMWGHFFKSNISFTNKCKSKLSLPYNNVVVAAFPNIIRDPKILLRDP